MEATSRRNYEMGKRALDFSEKRPDTDAGYLASEGKLKELVAVMAGLDITQREGLIDERAGAAQKLSLRRAILSGPIAHLSKVGRQAARDDHELGKSFIFKPSANTYVAFRTAAASMAAEAETHRDVLIKHGLAVTVLEEFHSLIEQFDAALALGTRGRTAHTGATFKLRSVAVEIGRMVRLMDGRNRQRFRSDEELLASWINASTVLGTRRTVSVPKDTPSSPQHSSPQDTTPPATDAGDVRPAA